MALNLAARIERRLLINYRVDAEVAAGLLPDGLRPQLVGGQAVAGVCLIRLGGVRPPWVPESLGWGGENAAHRIAVEWDGPEGPEHGVYIRERHTSKALPTLVGGRVFPGVHHRASFAVRESEERFHVALRSADGHASVDVDVRLSDDWHSELFPTLDDASVFFREGSTGWSPKHDGHTLEGLCLETDAWSVRAAEPVHVESSFFNGLPPGSAEFDCALVMQDVPVSWSAPGAFPRTEALSAR